MRRLYREKKAREFVDDLTDQDIKDIKKELKRREKPWQEIPGSPSLEMWEFLKLRGLGWINRIIDR